MKKKLITGRKMWAVLLITCGILYIIIEIIARSNLKYHPLTFCGHKYIAEFIRDCIFASIAIAGGGLMLIRNKSTWIFIMLFSIGSILNSVFAMLNPHYNNNIFEHIFLMPILGIIMVITFNNKNILKKYELHRHQKYGYIIIAIIAIVLLINAIIYIPQRF